MVPFTTDDEGVAAAPVQAARKKFFERLARVVALQPVQVDAFSIADVKLSFFELVHFAMLQAVASELILDFTDIDRRADRFVRYYETRGWRGAGRCRMSSAQLGSVWSIKSRKLGSSGVDEALVLREVRGFVLIAKVVYYHIP